MSHPELCAAFDCARVRRYVRRLMVCLCFPLVGAVVLVCVGSCVTLSLDSPGICAAFIGFIIACAVLNVIVAAKVACGQIRDVHVWGVPVAGVVAVVRRGRFRLVHETGLDVESPDQRRTARLRCLCLPDQSRELEPGTPVTALDAARAVWLPREERVWLPVLRREPGEVLTDRRDTAAEHARDGLAAVLWELERRLNGRGSGPVSVAFDLLLLAQVVLMAAAGLQLPLILLVAGAFIVARRWTVRRRREKCVAAAWGALCVEVPEGSPGWQLVHEILALDGGPRLARRLLRARARKAGALRPG